MSIGDLCLFPFPFKKGVSDVFLCRDVCGTKSGHFHLKTEGLDILVSNTTEFGDLDTVKQCRRYSSIMCTVHHIYRSSEYFPVV